MAKRGKGKGRKQGVPTSDPIATRHTFSSGGLLGHDLSASTWLVNVSEQTALGLDVVQDCVQVICDAVAGADFGQWLGTERIEVPSGFTLRPDPDMTRRDFTWLFAANLALYRSVYLEEATFDGAVVAVRIHCIANVSKINDGYYVGGQLIRNRMRLIRRSVWPTLDIDSGSTINLAREVFAGAMSANAYQSDYWQRGGPPVIYIKTDQEITGDQATGIGDAWETQRTTTPGRPPVMGKGADVKGLSADLSAAGASTSSDKLRASIARYFGMPPGIVNVPSEAGPLTYTTEEQEGIKLVKYTFQPYCDVIGEALSEYLPGNYLLGERIVLNPQRLTRASQLTRYQAWESAIRAQWLSPEEVRTEEGYAPGAPEPRPAPVVGEGLNVGA